MLIWRECLVLGDVRPVSIAASEHGVGCGGGGMGWAYNVHVGCRKDVMLRHATVWRCWSNFRDALDATLWRCWSNFRDKIGLGLDLLQELGKLMKSINKKIGYWKWADRRCKKASNVFREYVFEIHFFQKSRFRYSENDTKLILRRASNVFEPFFNIDRARFMNKVLRFTGNCALNL